MSLEEALRRGMIPTAPFVHALEERELLDDLEERFRHRIMHEQEYMTFDVADDTLVELRKPELWLFVPELRDVYYRVNLSTARPPEVVVDANGMSECPVCGSHFEQPSGANYGKKVYCHKRCSARALVRRRREELDEHRARVNAERAAAVAA